jgi:Dolichyl-phosphate-mannose-protein mannosyltransferase
VTAVTGVDVSERRTRAVPRVASRGRALTGALADHWAVAAVLAGALGLRLLAFVAIYPGIWFSDTNNYVTVAATGRLSEVRVGGYALLVAPFWHLGSAAVLVGLQHLLGLGIAVVLYAVLRRHGAPGWLAALAVIPAALDPYLIDIEHAVMSDTAFHAAIVAAIALLLWKERPGLAAATAAGLLLGYAGVVRSVGAPFFAVFVLYLLVKRVGWRPLVVFCAGWALVNVAYLGVYDAQHGKLAYSQWGGRFLYARVATWADCSKLSGLPADEQRYCPNPAHRMTSNGYLWGHTSPIHDLPDSADPRVRDLAMRVIKNDPARYAKSVGAQLAHFFEPGHRIGHNDYGIAVWQFPTKPSHAHYPAYRGPIRPHIPGHASIYPNRYIGRFAGTPHTNATVSKLLRRYQLHVYTSGLILLGCLVVVLVGLVIPRVPWRLKLDAALLAACTLAALVVASALSVFSYRYGLIAIILLPPAAALSITGMLRARS